MRMTFPHLSFNPDLAHLFLLRSESVPVDVDREEAVARLRPWHEQEVTRLGFQPGSLRLAEQVHGADIAAVHESSPALNAGADGLITASRGLALGIYVADCAAVYLADKRGRAIGLVHSGKKGSELGIVPNALRLMQERFGVEAKDVLVQISPCIRPPKYEIDFAAQIRADCLASGVRPEYLADCGLCTGSDLQRFYSYRMERGRTGRMLALLGWPS